MPPTITRPAPDEFAPYYAGYIAAVPDGDVLAILERQGAETVAMLRALPEERGGHRYAPEKWSVKTLVAHVIDAERIFAYRLLRIARGDQTPLASFDENAYAEAAGADARTVADLADELEAVRRATVLLLRSFDDAVVMRRGVASGQPVSVRGVAYIIAGHERHHVGVLRERYGVA